MPCPHGLDSRAWCDDCTKLARETVVKMGERLERDGHRGRSRQSRSRPHTTAAYGSICEWCTEPIEAGENLVLIPDAGWVHESCADEHDQAEAEGEV